MTLKKLTCHGWSKHDATYVYRFFDKSGKVLLEIQADYGTFCVGGEYYFSIGTRDEMLE